MQASRSVGHNMGFKPPCFNKISTLSAVTAYVWFGKRIPSSSVPVCLHFPSAWEKQDPDMTRGIPLFRFGKVDETILPERRSDVFQLIPAIERHAHSLVLAQVETRNWHGSGQRPKDRYITQGSGAKQEVHEDDRGPPMANKRYQVDQLIEAFTQFSQMASNCSMLSGLGVGHTGPDFAQQQYSTRDRQGINVDSRTAFYPRFMPLQKSSIITSIDTDPSQFNQSQAPFAGSTLPFPRGFPVSSSLITSGRIGQTDSAG